MDGKERPEVAYDEMLRAMDRLIALAQTGQQDIADRLGLNTTDLTCVGFLMEASLAGRTLAAGDLAEQARLTTGAVTGVLNRLEKAGYVRRAPDPGDRRRVRVVMDEGARERILAVYGPFYARLCTLAEDYGPQEMAVLADWFTRAREAMRESLEEIRDGGAAGA
ncbi:MarR family winged helix-turn-helix transcriptional regulator [Streptomyces sp. bgisy091]|uniref:MarR family winged helix-turn-helix transcriptional regulator n=2 Tax=Streptomyces TaxID=1883 RepID=UPI003D71C5A4